MASFGAKVIWFIRWWFLSNPPLTSNEFFAYCEEVFGFLIEEYGYRVVDSEAHTMGYLIRYQSDRVAISIGYETREREIIFELRLRREPTAEDPYIYKDLIIQQIAEQRFPGGNVIPDEIKYTIEPEHSRLLLQHYASLLRAHASDLLEGHVSQTEL